MAGKLWQRIIKMNHKAIIVLMLFSSFAAFSQEKIQIQLQSCEDSSAIQFAHVINKSSNHVTVSDMEGIALIPAEYGDTVMLTAVAFETFYLTVTEKNEYEVCLVTAIYDLNTVLVPEFRHDQPFFDVNEYMKRKEMKVDIPKVSLDFNSGVGLIGPITALYYSFSRYGKMLRELERQQLVQKNKRTLATYEYRTIIKDLTGIEDEDEMNSFIRFCEVDQVDIRKLGIDLVYYRIQQCKKQFDMWRRLNPEESIPDFEIEED